MQDKRVVAASAVVVLLASSLVMGLYLHGGFGPRFDPSAYREAGRALARQTLALLHSGESVTVVTRDTAAFEHPASDVLLKAFRHELSNAGAHIASIQRLQIDPLRPVLVPAGDFCQWIKNAPRGSVIVSFMGPPVLSAEQITRLGEIKPAIVALCPGPIRDQVDLPALFSRGLLRAAVVSKRLQHRTEPVSVSDRESFDRRFLEVTTANLAALSAEPTSSSP